MILQMWWMLIRQCGGGVMLMSLRSDEFVARSSFFWCPNPSAFSRFQNTAVSVSAPLMLPLQMQHLELLVDRAMWFDDNLKIWYLPKETAGLYIVQPKPLVQLKHTRIRALTEFALVSTCDSPKRIAHLLAPEMVETRKGVKWPCHATKCNLKNILWLMSMPTRCLGADLGFDCAAVASGGGGTSAS